MKRDPKPKAQKIFARIPSVIGLIVCIILAPVLIMNLVIIVKSYINPDQVPDFFGIKPFIVLSGSMEPTINTGDLVIVKTTNPEELAVRDIISFKDGNSVITHRIVELTQSGDSPAFITQGDANNTVDRGPVTYSQVEGIYLFKINKLGNLAMFMQTPMGLLLFVAVPLCAFILYDILRHRLSNSKEKAALDEAQNEINRLRAERDQKSTDDEDDTIE